VSRQQLEAADPSETYYAAHEFLESLKCWTGTAAVSDEPGNRRFLNQTPDEGLAHLYRCARCGTPSDLVSYAWEALGDGSAALCLDCLTGGEHQAVDEEDG
jgi:hypothetical protein